MIEYSPCSPSPTSFMEFEPSLLNRFKDKFSPSDWESLEKHLDDERKLSILKNALFGKLSRAQTRLEKESKMNVRDKCQLIGEMADYLYELQLVEHALKIPMLNIAKIIFSINPKRRVDKDSIQIKQKPIKKRKNELGGLVGEMSDELNKIPVREAKLLAASQVHRHHQEERFEEMDAIANDGPKRGRLKRRTIPTTGRSVKDLVAVVATNLLPTQSDNLRDMDDEQQKYAEFDKPEDGGETEAVNFLLMVAQIPSTLSDEGQQRGSTNSPQRTESAGNSAAELLHSPPRTRATKKRSRETDLGSEPNESTGSSNVKSPQKRQASATEHQQQWNEGEEIDQMEYGEENLERKGKRQLDEAEPTYCLCERVSFGEMICCDYELCSVEWFHFACVNIKSKPKGKKWFCPLCRHNDKANMLKPELLHKLDLMRHRSY